MAVVPAGDRAWLDLARVAGYQPVTPDLSVRTCPAYAQPQRCAAVASKEQRPRPRRPAGPPHTARSRVLRYGCEDSPQTPQQRRNRPGADPLPLGRTSLPSAPWAISAPTPSRATWAIHAAASRKQSARLDRDDDAIRRARRARLPWSAASRQVLESRAVDPTPHSPR